MIFELNILGIEQGRNTADLIPVSIDFCIACSMHEARVMVEERDPSKFPFLAPKLI